jgi:hypothetical protein
MNTLQQWFGLLCIWMFWILGWRFARTYHDDIKPGDAIRLPISLRWLIGKPNSDGLYNIRGIYFQLFTVILLFPFMLADFEILSRYQAFQLVFVGMICFPVFELIRYSRKKL